MRKLILLLLPLLLSGCMTINNYIEVPTGCGGNITVNISTEKSVPITPTLSADGNTVPVSAIP